MNIVKAKRNKLIPICSILIFTISIVTIGINVHRKNHSDTLFVPSIESIEQNGYPVNQNGETYGPQLHDVLDTPDLILVINDDGLQGYVKKEELDYTPMTTEEAGNISSDHRDIYYDMYLQDGETVIGSYRVQSPSLVIK